MAKHLTKKTRVIIAVCIVVAALGVGGFFVFKAIRPSASAVQLVADQAAFPIYEPSVLPAGYTIDPGSVSLTSQALLFSASNAKGTKLVFTETPVSQGFDFESFYKAQYVGMQDVQSIYGRGTTGVINGVMGGSLVTTSTWVLVTGTKDMPSSTMASIIQGLKPITNK